MEQFENDEKEKDFYHLSILKNGANGIKSMVEFSNNNLLSTCYIFL